MLRRQGFDEPEIRFRIVAAKSKRDMCDRDRKFFAPLGKTPKEVKKRNGIRASGYRNHKPSKLPAKEAFFRIHIFL